MRLARVDVGGLAVAGWAIEHVPRIEASRVADQTRTS